MSGNPSWIPGPWRGRLAIIPRPRGGDWLGDETRSWRLDGIDVVVSLLENEEAAQLELLSERDAAEANGIHLISFPIADRGIPASLPAALSLMTEIARLLERGENVALHCRQSVGPAGMIAAGVLIASGASPHQAIETVSAARGLAIPETPEQRSWLKSLPQAVIS